VSIGVASVQQQKMLLLHGAVYYREQRFAEQGFAVVAVQVSSISNLAKCLNISNSTTVSDEELQEQCLISATILNFQIFDHQQYVFNVHCQYQMRSSIVCQTNISRQQQVFKMSSKVECCNKDAMSFSSFSESE